jgi:hypothetical protein
MWVAITALVALPAQAVPIADGNVAWDWDFNWGAYAPPLFDGGDSTFRDYNVPDRQYRAEVSNQNGSSYADVRASMRISEDSSDHEYTLIAMAVNEIALGVDAGLTGGGASGRSSLSVFSYSFSVLAPVVYTGSNVLRSRGEDGSETEFQSGSLLLPGHYRYALLTGCCTFINSVVGSVGEGEELYARRTQTYRFSFRRAEVPAPGMALLLAGALPLVLLARRRLRREQ